MMKQNILGSYFKSLYQRTMKEAYARAFDEVVLSLSNGNDVRCLDCGASGGQYFEQLNKRIGLEKHQYFGVEWDQQLVKTAQEKKINVIQGDLNKPLPFESNFFKTVFAFSVLEHLLNGCQWLRETERVLEPGGTLVILTPNISTFFTIGLLLIGKMPSSGPHPDSLSLLKGETPFQVSEIYDPDVETDIPVHRHLVVFSFRVLRSYLKQLGFENIKGHGYGLYPFPNSMQPLFEKIDPYHCHQMVFKAEKRDGLESI